MAKSPDAFRTISEVAEWLGVEAHVLRFWETKFTQVKPVKRAGGRRYYRPSDMVLLGGIRRLLHDDGLTIRGVQKILREKGIGHVAAMSPELRLNEESKTAPPGTAEIEPVEHVAEPVASERAPADADEEATPTLPFDLPDAGHGDRADLDPHSTSEGAAAVVAAPWASERSEPAVAPAADAANAEHAMSTEDGDHLAQSGTPAPSARLRQTRTGQLDPAAAAPILERARRLAERLKGKPE